MRCNDLRRVGIISIRRVQERFATDFRGNVADSPTGGSGIIVTDSLPSTYRRRKWPGPFDIDSRRVIFKECATLWSRAESQATPLPNTGADMVTTTSYYKRYRMEIDLRDASLPAPLLPEGYHWESWTPQVLERHAWAKWESFRSEIDSHVFECLGDYVGCLRLMQEIYNRDTFLAHATWLISQDGPRGKKSLDCATIQGLAQAGALGSIQNVGVVPAHRGLGLGRALVLKSLEGFSQSGMNRVYLEVTAQNKPAVELYRSLGFKVTRTVYKAVEQELSAY